jgi:hypothetical protein
MKLGNSSSEVINLLLYSFRSPACLKFLPWEGESPEEFKERAQFFGLIEHGADWSRRAESASVSNGLGPSSDQNIALNKEI